MSFITSETVLASTVATSGTFTVPYPTGITAGSFVGGQFHTLFALQTLYTAPADFTVAFGASSATITWLRATALPAGSRVGVQLDRLGNDAGRIVTSFGLAGPRTSMATPVLLSFGTPATAAANNIFTSAAITLAAGFVVPTGTLVANSIATLDVPRNVVAAWTNTAVMTVRGTDEYGNAMRESSASGTSFTGKKAFRTITGISVSADVTGATVGTGVVLGLPSFLDATGLVLSHLVDGASTTAGTLAAGDNAVATALTGDVRGTVSPSAAPNGSRAYSLIAFLPRPNYLGRAQFAG